jgi:hypothetical protein
MRTKSVLLSLFATAAFGAGAAHANLITNGGFEATTNGTNKQLAAGTSTTASNRSTLVGWNSGTGTDGGYNFVLNGSILNTSASVISLRSTTSASGKTDTTNVFASDALYYPGVLSQMVNGLAVGSLYTLTFDYALGQQTGYSGVNLNNYWEVNLGGAVQDTTKLSIADGGFSGWQTATMTFMATSANELLSFLALSSSPGAPPFLLLDNVALNAAATVSVPEPSTCALLLGGFGALGWIARRRKRAAPAAPSA